MAIEEEHQAGVEERLLAARFIQECLLMGQKVLLHSIHGRHRTRWAFVAFRIYSGRSVRAALRQAAESPWLAPYHTNTEDWETFALSIAGERSI
jgi:hypothetical protein